jgi:hypothetical protein
MLPPASGLLAGAAKPPHPQHGLRLPLASTSGSRSSGSNPLLAASLRQWRHAAVRVILRRVVKAELAIINISAGSSSR